MWILLSIPIALILFYLYFNRDPERDIPTTGKLVSPADGRVLEVKTVGKNVTFKKGIGYTKFLTGVRLPATMIRIFLSPFNVHIQRAPIKGTVTQVKKVAGKRLAAYSPLAWQNEHAEITLKTKLGTVKIILIGGAVAGRVRPWVRKGQKVEKGERIGKILLGSQVCIIFPQCKTKTRKGKQVQAGVSIIA